MFERLAAALVTTAIPAAVGVAAAPVNPYWWIGEFTPMVIGVIMVIMVRALLDMNAAKKRAWNYNVLVMCLCSVFTAVFVHEYHLSAGAATLFGLGTGSTGVGIISFGKPALVFIMERAANALKNSGDNDTTPKG